MSSNPDALAHWSQRLAARRSSSRLPAGIRPASSGRRLPSLLASGLHSFNPPTPHSECPHVAAGYATTSTSISHAPPRMPSVTSTADLCATCVARALPFALSRSRIPIPNPPLGSTTRPTSWSLSSFGFPSPLPPSREPHFCLIFTLSAAADELSRDPPTSH